MFSTVSVPLAKFSAAIAAYAFNVVTAQHDQKPFRVDTGSAVINHGQAITPALSQYAEALLRNYSAPGLSVGVVHLQDETPVFEFGAWGNRTENGDHVTPESLFEIGSTSKAFLATSLGILMDDFANGRNITLLPPNLDIFNWKSKVKDVLPGEWKLLDKWANEKARIKDILNHVSGLPRHDLSYEPGESPADVVRRLRYLKPTRELREEWQYNNQMYVVGAYIVEKYAGQSYPAFVKSRIFSPLNMTSSTFSGTKAEATGHLCHAFIDPYDPNGNGTDGSPKRRIPFWLSDKDQEGLLAGAGGIVSNTIDMTKWLATLLNKGIEPNTKTRIIPRDTFEQTTAAHVVVPSIPMSDSRLFQPVSGYGMGWLRYTDNGRELVTHSGGLPGFLTSVEFLPNEGLGFVSFVNSDAFYINGAITQAMVQNVFGPQAENVTVTSSGPFVAKAKGDMQLKTPPKSPALPIESYAGTYSNPAYGTFTLCTTSSNTAYCRAVLTNFTTVFPDEHPGTQSLYAAWRRIWISHFVLSPSSSLLSSEEPVRPDIQPNSNKHSFSLQAWSLFPKGYGKNKAPFATAAASPLPISAAFVVEDGANNTAGSALKPKVKGLGFPGGFEVPVTRDFIPDERLKEDSLVYFERIEE
ncbi:beta-lactamase/transpeptidase-like protein [Panus rudis PR-1116 ss-1]|nr:beta-lactamase/transpeptidase-like protein [Panus rudis PR-1116 ss-1]